MAIIILAGCADRGEKNGDEAGTETADDTVDSVSDGDSSSATTGQPLAEPVVVFERTQRLLDVASSPHPFEHSLTLDPAHRHLIVYFSSAGEGQHQIFLRQGTDTIYISPPHDAEGDPDSQGPPIRVGEAEATSDQVTLRIEWSQFVTYSVRVETWATATMQITSPSFAHQGQIPLRHTCGGEGVSPQLEWSDAPPGAAVFALLMEDLDLPGGGVFTHWWMRNIPLDVTSVPEGQEPPSGETDPERGYFGPCPPSDETHRYLFKILALDQPLAIESKSPQEQLRGRVVAHGFLVGAFGCPADATCTLGG